MKIFILVALIALGVEAGNWRHAEYSQWPIPQGQTFRRGPVRNVYHQNGFSQWNPQQYYPRQNYPQQNINVDESFATAEWICRNPTTGDMVCHVKVSIVLREIKIILHYKFDNKFFQLIIASETKDQREETLDKSFQRNTNSHNIHSANEDLKKENDMKNHGGEGLIDVRVGV